MGPSIIILFVVICRINRYYSIVSSESISQLLKVNLYTTVATAWLTKPSGRINTTSLATAYRPKRSYQTVSYTRQLGVPDAASQTLPRVFGDAAFRTLAMLFNATVYTELSLRRSVLLW